MLPRLFYLGFGCLKFLVDAHGDVAVDGVGQTKKWSLDVCDVEARVNFNFCRDDANVLVANDVDGLAGRCPQGDVMLERLHQWCKGCWCYRCRCCQNSHKMRQGVSHSWAIGVKMFHQVGL